MAWHKGLDHDGLLEGAVSEPIKPALTPEEWERPHHWIQCYDSWSDEVATKSGVAEISAGPSYLTLTSHQHPDFADFSAPTDRHALAALALYGQPFGFTREDVSMLRGDVAHMLEMADQWDRVGEFMLQEEGWLEHERPTKHEREIEASRRASELRARAEVVRSLADRIEALLPPDTKRLREV